MKENAAPRFYKARSVPFTIKEAIELELNRLEGAGILKKVDYSEWTAPIVAVPKKDGRIRICGDHKVIVNQKLEMDQYPLPKPEKLFATLAGGKKSTKLDMSQAYQKLVLDEESTKYVTINTHRGLYRYTRLPFGVASTPAIFFLEDHGFCVSRHPQHHICPIGEGSLSSDFRSEESSSVTLWLTLHFSHGSQATDNHSGTKEGNPLTCSSQTATLGPNSSCLQL